MSRYLDQLKIYAYTDILGWSFTRYDTFQTCKRRYYYQYYRKYDFKNLSRINLLSGLTTVPMEIGNVTHKVLETLLRRLQKSFEPIDQEKLFDYARKKTFEVCREKTFDDVYYGIRDDVDVEAEIVRPVCEAMDNFLNSERLNWIYEEAAPNKDDWIIELDEPLKYGECRIDDYKAYCKVDFLFPVGNEIYIIDWKTGKELYNKYNTQLHGYAGWARCMFGVDLDRIKTIVAYTRPAYVEKSVQLNEYDLEDFAGRVRTQSEAMFKFCDDHHANIPLPKEEFPMTEAVSFCKTCNFRELCDRA